MEANIKRYNSFAAELMQHYMNSNKNANILFSPLSILILLAIASDATTGKTCSEIQDVMTNGSVNPEFKDWLIGTQKSITGSKAFSSANAVCVQEKIAKSIKSEFVERLREAYDGELFASADIVSDVNNWVRKTTHGMIDRVADDSVQKFLACLMNAVSFEDKWQAEYDTEEIYENRFTNVDGTVTEVPFLHSNEKYYIENDYFTGFTRPYKISGCVFMALLPRKQKSQRFLIRTLKDINFTSIYQSRTDQYNLNVSIPEFSSSFQDDLTTYCRELGMKEIFTEKADFSPMTSEWLKVDSIIHEAIIEVNRQGTKAAAVSAMFALEGCAPDFARMRYVNLDRPFIYAIIHEKTALPVFTGILNQI